jgi:hypothetical protein
VTRAAIAALTVSLMTAACATIAEEDEAVSRGCQALRQRYGAGQVDCTKLKADRVRDGWIVWQKLPPGWLGGSPTVELSSDGQVLRFPITQ